MNVEIGAEAALFPEKENINGIAVAVHDSCIIQATKISIIHYNEKKDTCFVGYATRGWIVQLLCHKTIFYSQTEQMLNGAISKYVDVANT